MQTTRPSKQSDQGSRTILTEKYGLLPVDFVFITACLLFIGSTFLEWRQTTVLVAHSQNVLSITAWDTGLLGGQGFVLINVLVLLLFVPVNRLFGSNHPFIGRILALSLVVIALGFTFQHVLSVYNGQTAITIKHSTLSYGFYLAMLASNLILLYLVWCMLKPRRAMHAESRR